MSEFDLQRFTVQLLTLNGRSDCVWFAVPNGEYRSKRTGARLKAMGVRPGVADIAIILPGGKSAFMELKSPTGRLSPEQRVFRADAEAAGALYAIADTPELVQFVLASWGALRPSSNRSVQQGRAA